MFVGELVVCFAVVGRPNALEAVVSFDDVGSLSEDIHWRFVNGFYSPKPIVYIIGIPSFSGGNY